MGPKFTGRNVRRLRESRAVSQEHLAQMAGISPRTVQRAEGGEPVHGETM